MKLSTAQQRLLLDLLERGGTEVTPVRFVKRYSRVGTIRVLKSLDLVAEDNVFQTGAWFLHFTPTGMSIARELRRMRFQEPKPAATST
jgi:hypothetical protein